MLCVLESPFSPLPHCVPASHFFLLEVLLLVPSPRLLLGIIISPHCCCEKDASICTKQDSSGPISLGIKDPWNNKKQCLPDSDSTRGLFPVLSPVFLEGFWPTSSCWPLLLLPGNLYDFLLPIPWPSSVFTSSLSSNTGFLALGLWKLFSVPLDWGLASVLFSQSPLWSGREVALLHIH